MGISQIRHNDTMSFMKGMKVYLDTNFLLAVKINDEKLISSQTLKDAKILFSKLLRSEVEMVISPLVLDEAWFILIKLLYKRDNGKNSWRSNTLKNNPGLIKKYEKELNDFTKNILQSLKFEFVSITQKVAEKAFFYMTSKCFVPRDSFHIAVSVLNGIDKFVTGDRDFKTDNDPNINLTVIKY